MFGPEWAELGPDQRKPYIDTSKQMAAGKHEPKFKTPLKSIEQSSKADLSGKFDSYGRSYLALHKKAMDEKGT